MRLKNRKGYSFPKGEELGRLCQSEPFWRGVLMGMSPQRYLFSTSNHLFEFLNDHDSVYEAWLDVRICSTPLLRSLSSMAKRGRQPPKPNTEGLRNAPSTRASERVTEPRIREEVEKAIGPLVGASQRGQIVDRLVSLFSSEVFHGPLPHPKHLRAYEDIFPGCADRSVKMAEIAQERREAETTGSWNSNTPIAD